MTVRPPRASRGVACLVAVAASAAAVGAAAAERRPVLIVDATADGSGAEAVHQLEGRLAVEDALGPVAQDVGAALHRPVAVDDAWQDELTAALAGARADLARFAYREAADRAHGALDRLALVADQAVARKQLAELALVEGQALVGAGDGARAELTFRLVQRLDPGRTLDPARYLPEVITAYLAAGYTTPATSTLHLAAPGAAELLVDGVAVGGEPRVVQVAPGPHLIAARGEAIATVGRRIDAPDGQAIRVDLVPLLAPLPVRVTRVVTRLRAAPDDAALSDAVATLLGLAQARDAVVVVNGATGLATRLYTARGGLAPARALEPPATTLAPLRPLVVAPLPRVLPPVVPLPPEPWFRQRWGKASIGVGVGVVLAALVTAMVVRDPGSSTFTGKADTQ